MRARKLEVKPKVEKRVVESSQGNQDDAEEALLLEDECGGNDAEEKGLGREENAVDDG